MLDGRWTGHERKMDRDGGGWGMEDGDGDGDGDGMNAMQVNEERKEVKMPG